MRSSAHGGRSEHRKVEALVSWLAGLLFQISCLLVCPQNKVAVWLAGLVGSLVGCFAAWLLDWMVLGWLVGLVGLLVGWSPACLSPCGLLLLG